MSRLLFFFLLISLRCFSQNSEASSDSIATYIEEVVSDSISVAPAIEAVIFSENDAAQQNQTNTKTRNFDKEKYEKTINGFNYNEKIIKKEKEKEIPKYNFKPPESKSYLGIFQVILIVVVAFFLILIIVLIVKQNTKNTRVNDEENWNIIDLDKTEKPIDVIELKIKEAIEQENFSLAIRLYYLKTIATLYINKWIIWKKDKTNAIYCNELFTTIYYDGFSELTLHFEYTWFGKRKIDFDKFTLIEKNFKGFISTVKPVDVEKKSFL